MTATNQTLADLSDDHRRLLESWVMDFDQHWDEDRLAAAVKQVPRDHPLRPLALAEMVKIDLERRWRQGRKAKLEAYLRALPELGTPDSVALDLIQAEVEARRQAGAPVALADFAARFPRQADELRRRLESPAASSTLRSPAPVAAAPSTLSSAPAAPAATLPEQFGRYRIVRKLGQGGMGAVYLAHDTQLDRPVALKVPRFTPEDSPELLERFHREARAAATLRHPHICPVYDVGQIDGVHYLTMAYIEGRLMSELVRAGQPQPQPQAAALVRQLALALAHAHAHGVIHRDLKPANVMLNQEGDPAIMDFGLARQVNKEGERLTKSGVVMGTPAYMSPEQVEGDVAAMGPGCDVYSLGVILYELLTGRLPFTGSMAAVLGQIVSQPPERPSAFRPDLNPQLESIVMKAMAKKIGDRYRSMDEFAAALTGYLHANPPTATPANRVAGYFPPEATAPPAARTGPRRRRPRWPWLVGLGAAALVALGIGIALNGGSGGDQTRPTAGEPTARGSGDTPPGTPKAAERVPDSPADDNPKDPVAFDLPKPLPIKGHTNRVSAVAFSPDSKLLATGSADKTIRLWDAAGGERKERIPHVTAVLCLAFAPDGKTLAAGDAEGKVTLWNVADGEKKAGFTASDKGAVSLIAYAPDGKTLVTVPYRSHEVDLWDVERQKVRTTLKGHTDLVMAVAFSPDGTTVATTGPDSTIRLWDAASGKEKDSLRAHDGAIYSLAFLKDGRLLSGGADHTVIVWDVKKGNVVKPVLELPPSYHREVVKVFATPAGHVLSQTAGWDLDVGRPGNPRPLYHRKGYEPKGFVVARVDFETDYHNRTVLSPDGKLLAGAEDNDVHLYDVSPYTVPAK